MNLPFSVLYILLPFTACAAEIELGDSSDFYPHTRYVWTISDDKIDDLPHWKDGDDVPLSVKDAETAALGWADAQRFTGRKPEKPFHIAICKFPDEENLYFYKFYYTEAIDSDSFWTVFVMMDGSVIKPTKIQP